MSDSPENTTVHDRPLTSDPRRQQRMVRRAALASFFGSTAEYYDFLIYGTAAALVFNEVFFPGEDPTAGTLAALATFGVGYIARPLGAIFFGHLGDRIGRRKVLNTTLSLMGLSTFAIGCIPSYDSIGIIAPLLLVIARLVQGLSAGAEGVGASLLTIEHAPSNRTGFWSSWMLNGTSAGATLGTLVFIPIAGLPDNQLISWGWRIPFFAGVLTAVIGLLIRRGVAESPEFTRKNASAGSTRHASSHVPLAGLLRRQPLPLLLVFLAYLFSSLSTFVLVFGLSYGTQQHSLDKASMLAAMTGSQLVALVFHPLFGALADRYGKKRVFVSGALLTAVGVFPYMAAIGAENLAAVFAMTLVLKGVIYSAPNGLWPSFFSERFAPELRYTAVGLATQIGIVLTGFTPTLAYLVIGDGSLGWLPAALLVGGLCVIAAVAAGVSRPYRPNPASAFEKKV
ncbi:MHS family MFS transporter [Pseudonocardia kujensis]|uniref:MFS transporter n=1 Tax=Pseudonocardia kujensis TaxID=1128675 RepID=UPI001E6150FC|nr:MFS transporter [Pseudonocardia kujensis]MCE0765284.1 MHS family MFS transporter [Pseudonocardia kujensis]